MFIAGCGVDTASRALTNGWVDDDGCFFYVSCRWREAREEPGIERSLGSRVCT